MQPKKSFQELEAMYARNEAPEQRHNINTNANDAPNEDPKATITDFAYFNKESLESGSGRKDFIEVKTFLPTKTDKMISSRYENPLTQLKSSTKLWKALTLFLALFSFVYFSLNLWATLSLIDTKILSEAPRPILQVSNLLMEMEDVMFYDDGINIVLDVWALVIYAGLTIILLRESTAYIEKSFEEKGKFERIVSRIKKLMVILFGLSYLAGTVFLLSAVHDKIGARGISNLFVFHSTKMVYLFLNVIAFRTYRSKKFVYEDLLLEALEPSDLGDDKSDIDDNIERLGHVDP